MAKFRYLFNSYSLKGLNLRNRIVMSPMCQYSAVDGLANDWHFVHYTSRAIGGVGLIIMEVSAVCPNGRITPHCLGLWNRQQVDELKRIVDAAHTHGAKIAIQIGHAGRKAQGIDDVVAPSAICYGQSDRPEQVMKIPRELSKAEIELIIQQFQDAAKRAVEAGFDAIELHGAHGYLIHQFFSPKSNQRTDEYGQDRMLFGVKVIEAVKAVLPEDMPLIMRISAQEYSQHGFDSDYGVEVAQRFADAGVDIFDVSGGGNGLLDPKNTPTFHAGYQVYLAKKVKQATKLPVIAVGMLENPHVADYVLGAEGIDLVALGRGLLRDPNWVLNIQFDQNQTDSEALRFVPPQYKRSYL